MKVYGFDDADVVRGELRAAKLDAVDGHFLEEKCAFMGWEFLSRRFVDAQKALIARMEKEGSDPELIGAVRGMKASFIPVDDD